MIKPTEEERMIQGGNPCDLCGASNPCGDITACAWWTSGGEEEEEDYSRYQIEEPPPEEEFPIFDSKTSRYWVRSKINRNILVSISSESAIKNYGNKNEADIF